MVWDGMTPEIRHLTGAGLLDESNTGLKKNPMKVNL
jgi:hypothetical protein